MIVAMRIAVVALLGSALAAAAPVAAGEIFAGIAGHDLNIGLGRSYERSVAVIAGARTAPLGRLLGGDVRGHLLVSVNTDGGLDFAALGASLRWPIGGGRFYIAPGLGAAVHDGPGKRYQATPDRFYPGSRLLFEPELVVGAVLSRRVAAELAYVHLSHAQLGGRQNPGLDTIGARLVYHLGK